jgi:hypothetical protein
MHCLRKLYVANTTKIAAKRGTDQLHHPVPTDVKFKSPEILNTEPSHHVGAFYLTTTVSHFPSARLTHSLDLR